MPERRGLRPLNRQEKEEYQDQPSLPTPALKHVPTDNDPIRELEWLNSQQTPHIFAVVRSPQGNEHAYHFNRENLAIVHKQKNAENPIFLELQPIGTTNPNRQEMAHAVKAVATAFREAVKKAVRWEEIDKKELETVAKALNGLEKTNAEKR